MDRLIRFCCSTAGAVLAVSLVLSIYLQSLPARQPIDDKVSDEMIDRLIGQLETPEGKVKYLFKFNPGGPEFEESEPMRKLIQLGNTIQPRLLIGLKLPRIQNEVAIILAQVGDKDAIPPLIELLPTKEKLTKEEQFSAMCLLYSLWCLTDMPIGISGKWTPEYTPDFRKEWQNWYEVNKNYLYTPSKTKQTPYALDRARVLVDVEAKLAERPTSDYRKENPWVSYEDIKVWRDDPAYEKQLKEFCLSIILQQQAIRSLRYVHDPRALAALHKLCTYQKDIRHSYYLIWTLEEIGDPSSIPYLEKIPPSTVEIKGVLDNEPYRTRAMEHLRRLEKYRKELKDKKFDSRQEIAYVKCLEGPAGVEELIANLRANERESRFFDYLEVAAYVDQESVRSYLKEKASNKEWNEPAKLMVHAALARLGEKDSLNQVKKALEHKDPSVRIRAAESLWQLRNREGAKALIEILGLRPLETGGEGVSHPEGTIVKVTAVRNGNVDHIRAACKLLGEMGEKSAIEPLKALLPLNLNGVSATGGSGSGWSGRPDVVALAKLGDFSGIALLRASIKKGDPLDVFAPWVGKGDFVEIGLKRFIPEILPMFEHRERSKWAGAAEAILLLLENGR